MIFFNDGSRLSSSINAASADDAMLKNELEDGNDNNRLSCW